MEVRQALSIPIAGGEASFGRYGFRDMLLRRCVDILQPDVAAAGGISECKKIFDMASAFGVRCNPHVWGTGISIAASLQLLAVVPSKCRRDCSRWPRCWSSTAPTIRSARRS